MYDKADEVFTDPQAPGKLAYANVWEVLRKDVRLWIHSA